MAGSGPGPTRPEEANGGGLAGLIVAVFLGPQPRLRPHPVAGETTPVATTGTSLVGIAHTTSDDLPFVHPCDHVDMPVTQDRQFDPQRVDVARSQVISREDAERLSRLLALVSDPVRCRLLFALVAAEELCVGDLTLVLGDVTDDQVSYALKLLRMAGLVETRRSGRVIHYRLARGFPHQLLDHCLRQLLSISTDRAT